MPGALQEYVSSRPEYQPCYPWETGLSVPSGSTVRKPESPKELEKPMGKEIPRQYSHLLLTTSSLSEASLEGKYTHGDMPLYTLLSIADLCIFVSFIYSIGSFILFTFSCIKILVSFCQSLSLLGQTCRCCERDPSILSHLIIFGSNTKVN